MTRGAGGMRPVPPRIKPEHIPAYGSDEVADVTGAGDTVIAVFTLALLGRRRLRRRGSPVELCRRSGGHEGRHRDDLAGRVDPGDRRRPRRRETPLTPSRSKVRPLAELLEEMARLRRKGRTVALANGLFDILHVGHLRYLEAAADEADLLLVGINSDRSARTLKGPSRPVCRRENAPS